MEGATPRDSKDLLHGTLDLLVLRALAGEPMHGFALSKWIDQRTNGDLGNNYTFRVISAAMSMGSRSPVAQQVTDARDLAGESWRKVEPGSTEADAARATCEVADWAASSRR